MGTWMQKMLQFLPGYLWMHRTSWFWSTFICHSPQGWLHWQYLFLHPIYDSFLPVDHQQLHGNLRWRSPLHIPTEHQLRTCFPSNHWLWSISMRHQQQGWLYRRNGTSTSNQYQRCRRACRRCWIRIHRMDFLNHQQPIRNSHLTCSLHSNRSNTSPCNHSILPKIQWRDSSEIRWHHGHIWLLRRTSYSC